MGRRLRAASLAGEGLPSTSPDEERWPDCRALVEGPLDLAVLDFPDILAVLEEHRDDDESVIAETARRFCLWDDLDAPPFSAAVRRLLASCGGGV